MQRVLLLHSSPIRFYLFHAYPLSILAQADAYLSWLYSTHIRLFNFPGEERNFRSNRKFFDWGVAVSPARKKQENEKKKKDTCS